MADSNIMVQIADLNEQSSDLSNEEINSNIHKIATDILNFQGGGFTTNEELDQITHLVENPLYRLELFQKLHGDLVCELSQGRLNEDYGPNACAAIAMKASIKFLDNPGKQPFESEDEMYTIMKQGIEFYKNRNYQGKVDFVEILSDLQTIEPKQGLEIIYPDHLKGIEDDVLVTCRELKFPMNGKLKTHLKSMLEFLDQLTMDKNQQACGVFTSNGETMVIAFPQPHKPVLFDSHGRQYHKMDKGASIRQFDSSDQLVEYLTELYELHGDDFQFIHLTKTGELEKPKEGSKCIVS